MANPAFWAILFPYFTGKPVLPVSKNINGEKFA